MDERGFELAKEEKEKILKKHTDCSQCTDADVDELLKTEKSFPLISELLSASKTFEGNILAFYREPFVEIKKEILSLKDISKEQCMCLFILNVCGNRLTKENFEEKEDDYKHIESIHDDRENGVVNNDRKSEKGNNEKDIEKSNDCNGERIDNYKNDNKNDNEDGKNNNDNYELDKQMINDLLKAFKLPESTSKRTLFESLNQFRGHYFVKRIKDIFQITNGSFLRALTHIFCTSFPAQFLKYCPSNFFRTLTTSTAQSDIIPKVQLQDNYINLFVDIIQEDIKTGTFLDVFLSPWIRDKSVLTNLLLRFESMPYEKMIELTLNSKLNAHLKIAKPKVRKQMTGFSRLDLIGLSKEVSPIILSLVLNLDDLYHAMFTLIRNNANGSKYLNNAPLMSACCVNGREDLARLVLDIANDRKRCWSKRENIYPMHIAANFLNTDILDLALVGEHDVNMTTRTMESPFFLAAAAGKYALQNIPWTLKQELSNSTKTYDELVEENRLKILTLLWQRGADVNIHPDKSSSALAYACQKGDIDTIQFMIKSGASVKETNDENFGALHFASEVGNIEIVQLLLCSGADINICTSKGLTPLYLASFNGHADVVDMFLSKGTTQVLKDKSECNPFFVACKHGHERIVEMFLEYDPFVHCKLPDNTSALLAAVDNGHKEIVELLLKKMALMQILFKTIVK
ncbi:uncharacterized protein LOC130053590 [Ostrea edulis]|uniref:uncharacterized protein LOC130053590 n=1 Tax=Ostrea edulis TaxID=37623 RepID=UPI0024AF2FC9|nr:uncharacterized protein LOC130053590 [Ostrea edulis]